MTTSDNLITVVKKFVLIKLSHRNQDQCPGYACLSTFESYQVNQCVHL